MKEINAMTIQEMLMKQDVVSIAWLQKKLELSYTETRRLAELLCKRGWLGRELATGYKVEKTALCLRKLEQKEVGDLVDHLTNDCYLAMAHLLEHSAEGADFSALEKVIRGDGDTRDALEILHRHNLVYQCDGFYFLRVNQKTVEAVQKMIAKKREMERRDRVDRQRLIAYFDGVFS